MVVQQQLRVRCGRMPGCEVPCVLRAVPECRTAFEAESGLSDFVCELVENKPMKRYIDWTSPTPKEMFGMDKAAFCPTSARITAATWISRCIKSAKMLQGDPVFPRGTAYRAVRGRRAAHRRSGQKGTAEPDTHLQLSGETREKEKRAEAGGRIRSATHLHALDRLSTLCKRA